MEAKKGRKMKKIDEGVIMGREREGGGGFVVSCILYVSERAIGSYSVG